MICTLFKKRCGALIQTFVKWPRQLFQKALCASLSLTYMSLSLTNFMSIPEHKSCVSNSHMSARQSECSVFSHHLSHSLNVGRPRAAVSFLTCVFSSAVCQHLDVLCLNSFTSFSASWPLLWPMRGVRMCVCFLSIKERKFVCGFWSPQLLKLQQIHLPLFHVQHVSHWICD